MINFDLLFLLGFFQGLILSLVLLVRRQQPYSNKLLGVLIFLLSIQILLISGNNKWVLTYPDSRSVNWTIPFLFAPLTYLYVKTLLYKAPLKWSDCIHFLPFVLSFFALIPYFALPFEEKINFDIRSSEPFFHIGFAFECSRLTLAPCYSVISLSLIRRFRLAASETISNVSVRWVQVFVYVSLLSWIVAFLGVIAYFLKVDVLVNPFYILYLFTLIAIYGLNYKVLAHPLLFGYGLATLESTKDDKIKYAKSGWKEGQTREHLQRLLSLMKEEKMYLKSDLTIFDVAEKMALPKHHVSQLINEHLNQNFFDFVNTYRLDHAKAMLKDPAFDHLKILAIAFDAGFNSKSSFNTLFKKHAGMTPSKFRDQKL